MQRNEIRWTESRSARLLF